MQTLASEEKDPAATGDATAPRLGRFILRRVLGKGPAAVVWLAWDPRHEREVVVKLLNPADGTDPNHIAQWLARARNMARLVHPRIVSVLEADLEGAQPYLVLAHVPARTLAAVLAERGALPPAEAVTLMRDVLEALAAAHAAHTVHRNLHPGNVLVDENGRAHVVDFALAPSRAGSSDAEGPAAVQGKPGYLSPEAALGQPTSAAMDIFAAGLLLTEMLSGEPLIDGSNPEQALYRVVHEQLAVPPDIGAGVDDRLRAILQRALARDPAMRYAGAQQMREVLASWSGAPSGSNAGGADANGADPDGGDGPLQNLLRRMRHKSDFPAMSDAVMRIQALTSSETESIGNITNEILKDVALTHKLLRLVNSAHYARAGGSIRTVSRAVSLVGLNGIRNMALSLVLLERMGDKTHAAMLQEEFLRCLMAGAIGGELCPLAHETEEAFIASMFQELGRLLTGYYFPDEARTIRGLTTSTRAPVKEETASASVLGLGFEALGIGVARAWAMPESIQRCIRKPLGAPPSQTPAEPMERLRWLTFTANEIADLMLHTAPRELDARLLQLATRHAKALGLKPPEVLAAVRVARGKLIDMATALHLHVAAGSPAARLLVPPGETGDAAGQHARSTDSLAALELQAIEPIADPLQDGAPKDSGTRRAEHVAQTLTAGIQDITHAMVEDYKLNDVLRMILETMLRALDFRYIVFCMRDAKTDTLTGRFGLGKDVERVVKVFHVPLKAAPTTGFAKLPDGLRTTPDLLAAVCARGADTMISDATEPRIAERLPAWFHQHLRAPAFLLLPLQMQGKAFGLIYADMAQKSGLRLDERELELLRTLRNQAVMAFKRMN